MELLSSKLKIFLIFQYGTYESLNVAIFFFFQYIYIYLVFLEPYFGILLENLRIIKRCYIFSKKYIYIYIYI